MSNPSDFVIENGVLKKYKGPGGDVVIPDDVTSIGDGAFYGCGSLTSVTIPESVTSICDWAFYTCSSLTSVTIRSGVTRIGDEAFYGCSSLTSVTIPGSVTSIGNKAFYGCSGLTEAMFASIPESVANDIFNDCGELCVVLTPELTRTEKALPAGLSRAAASLNEEELAWILLYQKGKGWRAGGMAAAKAKEPGFIFAKMLELAGRMEKLPAAVASNATDFCLSFSRDLPAAAVRDFTALLQEKKCGKQIAALEADPVVLEKLRGSGEAEDNLNPAEHFVIAQLAKEKCSPKEVTDWLRDLSAIKDKERPQLLDVDGKPCAPYVLAWLLTAHEEKRKISGSYCDVVKLTKRAEPKPEVRELLKLLDEKSVQSALLNLTDQIAATGGINKRANLLYAICRYASEKTMVSVCSRSRKMSGFSQAILFEAVCASDTRAAILFADKQKFLDRYAALRGTDADTMRDKVLADFGLDQNGAKRFDMGNGTLTVRLQPDLSLEMIDDSSGKVVKAVPKKNADLERWQQVKAEVSDLKSGVKKVAKGRTELLFQAFLSGAEFLAVDWRDIYLANPVFRAVAQLLVWAQGEKSFTLADQGIVDSGEQPYTITDAPIRVAHPMEMNAAEVKAWQQYFTRHGLKQPFLQIWEPVYDPATIREDRYTDCMIPYYRFAGQEKHGITVNDYDFHNDIEISFADCSAEVERIDWERHAISMNHRFEVKKFSFKRYTRRINHYVAYLDRITVWDRVKKDDVSVMDWMGSFTLAQITDFIQAAQEAQAVNVLALLLEYKNAHFADFDPMDEFTLEW